MAQYQHLPIYKQTYDILLRTMTATKDFPREYKYTLGQKIKDELIELVVMRCEYRFSRVPRSPSPATGSRSSR